MCSDNFFLKQALYINLLYRNVYMCLCNCAVTTCTCMQLTCYIHVAVLFLWWVPRSGMGSLLNFGLCLEPCHLPFFLNLRLLFLAVLESGAPSSSSLEEALYNCSV